MTEFDEETHCHVVAFYNQVIVLMNKAGPSWQLIRKEKHDRIKTMLIRQRDGEELKELRAEYPQCYKWCRACQLDDGREAWCMDEGDWEHQL